MFYIPTFFLMGLMVVGAGNFSEIKKAGIPPEKAFILFTEESWGCISNQQVKEDVTELVASEDEKFARVDEIKNPEDVANRDELYLCFRAKEVGGLPGYCILRLGVSHEDPLVKGHLLVDQARLISGDNGYSVELKAKADGLFKADILYGKQPQLKVGFFSCPEAGLFEPQKVSFLKAYEIRGDLGIGIDSEVIDERWNNLNVTIDLLCLEEARFVDACEGLLDALDKEFSSFKDLIFFWDKSRVTTKSIEDIASQMEQESGLKYNVSIIIRYKEGIEEINRNGMFTPRLRQKISVKESNGHLNGGEIWIDAEPVSKQ